MEIDGPNIDKGVEKLFEITVIMGGQEIDLFIPKKVTLGRLCTLLKLTFVEQGHPLPKSIVLNILDKSFNVGTSELLSDFGVGNGDKIEILIGANNEII